MTVHKNIILGLGSNLGDREMNLLLAIKKINEQAGTVDAVSSLYKTAPWGNEDQPEFLNQVIILESALYPQPLLTKLHAIELELGRKTANRWAPRTLDIDILFFGDEIINRDQLCIPHPAIPKRRFVLQPLCELVPSFRHPLLDKTCYQLLQECNDPLEVSLFVPA